MILKAYTVGSLAVRAYLIGCPDTGEAMIIDPAGSEKMLAEEIDKAGLTLSYIVNTHGHPDHTCGNRKMKDLTGAPVLMHELDDRIFREPAAVQIFRSWGFEPAPPADRHVGAGDMIKIGNLEFDVIHTPGHSPGSVCIYGMGYIVTGDTLFVGAVGRTDLPEGSYDILMQSLKEYIVPLPDSTIVLPGHDYGASPQSTIGHEKKYNPYLNNL
ncbi:MAG TPA: MBL fold metallo-hydrolase [Thermodesulfobacteriaceae bacterium]|nr:MBL fold metallo-hydrolase [Thermodesulfobacteriaceae bacterium]